MPPVAGGLPPLTPEDPPFRSHTRLHNPSGGSGYGLFFFGYASDAPPVPKAAAPVPERSDARAPEPEPTPVPIPATPAPPDASAPTVMYVIPNCYAGNVPPRSDRLPPGCDISQVRVLR